MQRILDFISRTMQLLKVKLDVVRTNLSVSLVSMRNKIATQSRLMLYDVCYKK